ncbi:MAG: glycosyltransferase family 4 protein [Desulfovibrionaceae bacterium]|nr:glycosyltransferase family 4 protein [Desulfovibrionaceae bacterium]
MQILMLGWEFPPHISGGLGTACFGMTQALAQKGAHVIFVLPKTRRGGDPGFLSLRSASGTTITYDTAQRLEMAGDTLWQDHIRFMPIMSPLTPYLTPEAYTQALHDLRQSSHTTTTTQLLHGSFTYNLEGGYGPNLMEEVYRYSRLAAAIALNEHFDVIHAHDWMTYPAALLAKALTGKPLVCHIHATEYDRSGENINTNVASIERAGLLGADRVVAVSRLTRDLVVQRYGVPREKVTVVYNAVTRPQIEHHYVIPPRLRHEKRVLFLGRVTYQKGPEYFMEAARLVLQKIPHVRFYMAGSGDMLPGLIRRASQLRIGRRFHFAGFLRGEEVNRMFALSDLYVMPSVSEPFGITPLEAMLYDVPVLLSRQSGVSEILHHALKADFWDTRDMADKICAVLQHPALASEIVQNCREEMKTIRWENAAEQLLTVYEDLVGGH